MPESSGFHGRLTRAIVRVLCASGSGFGGLIGGCLLVVGERLVGCGGEAGRLRGQAVQTVANESGAPTSWRPTQCYLNQISSYQIETVSTIQINLMKIY